MQIARNTHRAVKYLWAKSLQRWCVNKGGGAHCSLSSARSGRIWLKMVITVAPRSSLTIFGMRCRAKLTRFKRTFRSLSLTAPSTQAQQTDNVGIGKIVNVSFVGNQGTSFRSCSTPVFTSMHSPSSETSTVRILVLSCNSLP